VIKLSELVKLKMEEPEPVFKVKLPKPNNDWKLPELSYGQNPEVPAFSSAVSLEYNKKLGRHLIANREINTGNFCVENQ
jgi:hypothetical protein